VFDTAANVDAQKTAMKGFVHTIQGMEFEVIYLTHYDTGAPIDVDHPLGSPLGPFVSKDDVLKEANRLLDLGKTELLATTSTSFTFGLSLGYKNLDTPLTFLKFNRAMRAQTALYAKDYATVLKILNIVDPKSKDPDRSFIVDPAPGTTPALTAADLNVGAFHSYSTGAGDQVNGLFNRTSVLAHPSFETDAQKQADGSLDQRFQDKISIALDDMGKEAPTTSANDDSLSSALSFTIYNAADAPVPVIRNEELLLIKAEALWFTSDHAGAIDELNKVRTLSGKLPALTFDPAMTNDQFIDALLYERRYSLMYEGGHRWIDLRRFNRPLPLDDMKAHKQNFRYPVPQGECDARPGEAACTIKSTDPLPAN